MAACGNLLVEFSSMEGPPVKVSRPFGGVRRTFGPEGHSAQPEPENQQNEGPPDGPPAVGKEACQKAAGKDPMDTQNCHVKGVKLLRGGPPDGPPYIYIAFQSHFPQGVRRRVRRIYIYIYIYIYSNLKLSV